ncbi:unnamed protein product [Linum trigynum]|uniref:Acid phosphatase/vanadium-dependent haloperoxidase-related protein n=1 Tax=Linum trigynum TaxID=586398 RepID=A0AAV2FY52_9ROSI
MLDVLFGKDFSGILDDDHPFQRFPIQFVVEAPQQSNDDDSGTFVVKLMKGATSLDKAARDMRKEFHSEDERLNLVLELVKWEFNKKKDEIEEAAKKHVATKKAAQTKGKPRASKGRKGKKPIEDADQNPAAMLARCADRVQSSLLMASDGEEEEGTARSVLSPPLGCSLALTSFVVFPRRSAMNEFITTADASARFGSATPQPSIIPSNVPLISAFLALAIAQFLKPFTVWFKERRWDSKRMLGSGGMPSSHSATVTALAVAIALEEGTGAPIFAVALVLACVVMYDATGVRLHAGRQAEIARCSFCNPPRSAGFPN